MLPPGMVLCRWADGQCCVGHHVPATATWQLPEEVDDPDLFQVMLQTVGSSARLPVVKPEKKDAAMKIMWPALRTAMESSPDPAVRAAPAAVARQLIVPCTASGTWGIKLQFSDYATARAVALAPEFLLRLPGPRHAAGPPRAADVLVGDELVVCLPHVYKDEPLAVLLEGEQLAKLNLSTDGVMVPASVLSAFIRGWVARPGVEVVAMAVPGDPADGVRVRDAFVWVKGECKALVGERVKVMRAAGKPPYYIKVFQLGDGQHGGRGPKRKFAAAHLPEGDHLMGDV